MGLATIVLMGLTVAVVLVGLFVAVERRTAEPILPLRLFGNRTFMLASGTGLVIGIAMFGVISFLPLFLQTVNGASATDSGLLLAPLMLGLLASSILAGRSVTRTGRYRQFPIIGHRHHRGRHGPALDAERRIEPVGVGDVHGRCAAWASG